ncbi:acyltransferase family protein [Albidovulum sp.]|uniref:acyltransferase family protein n=1 Tax=Albidovulum sp. TaxID=1872424 RepID=UPI0039B9652A
MLPQTLARGAIPSLDGIRAVSVAIVFFAHAGLSDAIAGGFGVTIFFFLSGFLITTLFIREWRDTGRIHIGKFYVRRFLRLSPPLFFTLGLGYLLVWLGFADGKFDALAVLSQLFYFHNYYLAAWPDAGSVVVGLQPLWSLSVEEHFYLLFPLIFLLFTRGKVGVLHILALLVAIVAWRYVRWQVLLDTEWTIYISTDTRFDSILFGCLLALLERDGVAGRFLPTDTRRLTPVLLGALVVLALSILARDVTFRSTLRYTVQGGALMVVFHYAVTRPDYWLFRPLNFGWVKTLGLYSYSIYLAHYVIIRILQKHGWFEGNAALFIAAAAIICIAYAAFLWHVIEAIPRRLRHRFA